MRCVFRIMNAVALVLVALGWSSPASAQLLYPDNQTITENTVVGLKLTNQGSKGVLELYGSYASGVQEPVLTVRSGFSGMAASLSAVHDGSVLGVEVASTCTSGNCVALKSHTNVGTGVHALGTQNGVKSEGYDRGVWGLTRSTSYGTGVLGSNYTLNGSGFGVSGTSAYGTGAYFAAYGTNASSNYVDGVIGESWYGNGAWGISYSTGASGVYGLNNSGSGYGVAGRTSQGGMAVYGDTGHISNGFSGYFTGKVQVIGLLAKGGGSFKIDHPLDPANKFLSHSFVESPDMMNVYNGIVTLDASGSATVQMPEWFTALNRDFRYQLTSIGKFAPVYVSAEVGPDNKFSIAGGIVGQRISWQVTGIRQDKFANQNRVPTEENKSAGEAGKYLHPTAFGLSQSMAINNGPKGSQ